MSTTHGYLLIADITGYTQYLSESELEHAQQVLTVLLELLVERTRPPLIISRLAGDAVISYGLRDNFLTGQTFVEVLEDCYTAFRAAIERMVLNTTCRCNACANIGNLDLKFFVHFGAFALQRIRDRDELVGSDVNLIHRLLKNHVVEQTGFRAYTLYTEAAIQQLGLGEICAAMTPHAETYEHLGEVKLWVQDMHPVWERKRAAGRIAIPADQVLMALTDDFALPPERVWDYLSQPEYRKTLMNTHRHDVVNLNQGRIGPGSVYQCYHGDRLQPQTVLEWQPFERVVTQDIIPMPIPNVTVLIEYRLEPIAAGTRFTQVFGRARGPWLGRLLCNFVLRGMAKQGQQDIRSFRDRIQADYAARGDLPPAAPSLDAAAIGQAATESLQTGHEPG
jgi:uncharacterized protein YndB with AHSA1/START domain